MRTYRTFIAIEVPVEIRRQIGAHIDRLRAAFPDVRASWSRADNLHLTLKFLGNVEVSRIDALSQACANAVRKVDRLELAIGGCGTFPPHGQPKVLWLGVRDARVSPNASAHQPTAETSDRLLSLHAAIEECCAAAGFAREARAYHPHLTLARIREARDSRALSEHHRQAACVLNACVVSEVVLFRSELTSKGSKHTALSRHRLGER